MWFIIGIGVTRISIYDDENDENDEISSSCDAQDFLNEYLTSDSWIDVYI